MCDVYNVSVFRMCLYVDCAGITMFCGLSSYTFLPHVSPLLLILIGLGVLVFAPMEDVTLHSPRMRHFVHVPV